MYNSNININLKLKANEKATPKELIVAMLKQGFHIDWYSADGSITRVSAENYDNLLFFGEHDFLKAYKNGSHRMTVDWLLRMLENYPNALMDVVTLSKR